MDSDDSHARCKNPSPPCDFDFETAVVRRRTIYYTASGEVCQYMNEIDPECFSTPSEEEDWGPTSSSSSEDESAIVPIKPLQKKLTKEKEPLQTRSNKESLTTTYIEEKESSTSTKPKAVRVKQEKKSSDEEETRRKKKEEPPRRKKEHRHRHSSPPKSKKWSGVEYSDSEEEREYKYKPKQDKKLKYDEPEDIKLPPCMETTFGEYICDVCNIVLNSEVTYNTHMAGKRHKKALKANAIQEVAKLSLYGKKEMKCEPMNYPNPRSRPFTENLDREAEHQRLPPPPPGYKREPVHGTISHIQQVADDYRRGPLPGLSKVQEIRGLTEVTYYCKLCDSPCSSNSIMEHLKGYKHRLHCFEVVNPRAYENLRYSPKPTVERRLLNYFAEEERMFGRGTIEVLQEIEDHSTPIMSEPGPSWRNAGDLLSEYGDLSNIEDLDISQNDFRCKICDSHMNNKSMWEAHVRGKRHLKNKNKIPGEGASKIKAFPCPGAVPHLINELREISDPVVGLDYIRETQGEGGDLYNCFLCGSCTSSYDVIEHIMSSKHRLKYLEAANKKGQTNTIQSIKLLYDVSQFYKDSMINQECQDMVERYGSGTIDVYVSKGSSFH